MIKQTKSDKTKVALLLTGGGARAAYQVGMLKAIVQALPRTAPLPFDIINGTSAGAINSTALACYASCGHLAIRKLEWVWRNFTTSHVYRSDFFHVFGHIVRNMLASFQSDHANRPPASLFDNQPLRELLGEVLNLDKIDRNIHRGFIDALSITASSYTTGHSVTFYQGENIRPWHRAKRRGELARLDIEHLMASSAIPMVFPSVRIRQHYYGDGSVHQMAPLSPAIHLGAKKIFIIGVEQPKQQELLGFEPHYPGVSAIAGHLLDTIFLDSLQSDLERLDRINRTLSLLPSRDKHQELKQIDTLVVNPSHNFNSIANEYYDEMPFAIRLLLRLIGVKHNSESSLTSYLLFEQAYTQHLIDLGYQDGLAKREEICDFLELSV